MVSYHVCEEESWMTKFEMFEERVELLAVEAAPGTVEVLPGLGLLSAVVVVQELINYPRHLITHQILTKNQPIEWSASQ